MVWVSDLGCFALVGADHVAKDDGENNGEANNDEPESGVLQIPTTVTSLSRSFSTSGLRIQPNTVARVALHVVGIERI